MANWYQRKPSDDARLIMLLKLKKVELVAAALELAQYRCEHETDDIPASVKPFIDEIESLGLVQPVEEMLRSLRTKRRNRGGTTGYHVVPDKIREDKNREEKRRQAPPSGVPDLKNTENEFDRFVPAELKRMG